MASYGPVIDQSQHTKSVSHIMSLIALLCSLNPQYLPFLSILLHAFQVDLPFYFQSDC